MRAENELTRNILMHDYHIYGKKCRIHERVTFLAEKRSVEYRRDSAQKRFLPFLPLKCRETREYLQIPEHITTEAELWNYVKEKKRFWLNHHSRRPRRNIQK